MGTMLEAAGKQETNTVFLEQAIGAAKAATAMGTINDAVAKLPGDDTVIQGLLSQAVAKDASLTASELENMGTAAADYFSAMSYYGKSSSEAFQDMNNYLLTGNTAEIERSPILANHIDKLKEGTTLQERSKLLQEALNEEHWGGMSQQDTYNNKLETFNGMLERGKYNLGGMFQEGAKWGMDFLMNVDSATGGLVGMGFALASFAAPLTDSIMGLGQIANGLNALKDAGDLIGLSDKLGKLKTTLIDAGTAAKNAALSMLDLGRKTLTAGANALKSAGMWVIQKAQLIATTIAEKAAAIAQWALNVAMSMNPIMLVVIAIGLLIAALAYLYFNNEQVRAAIDGLGQSLMALGQTIYDWVIGAWNSFISTIQMVWSSIVSFAQGIITTGMNAVNWVTTSFLAGVAFLASLRGRIWTILSNIINKVISWGRSIASNFLSSASKSVSNFISYISQIPGKLATELSNALNKVNEWAATLPQKFWDAGVNAVKNFLNALGIHSPGIMQRTLVWEISEMARRTPIEGKSLLDNVSSLGSDVVDEFGNPRFGLNFDDANTEFANGSIMGGQVINLNMEIGNVDSDDRIQEIVDAVRRELAWDNKTAGRTI
jgi:hypothetical protein